MHSVVVLNKYGQYFGETSLRRVIKWLAKNKIEVLVEKEDEEVCSVTVRIKIPLVVRLLHFAGYKIKHETVAYSDHAVYDRDNNECQYWHFDERGKRFKHRCTESDRTIDHVTPKNRGGITSFTNCVTCCRWHNVEVKRGHRPEEAGMELIRAPFVPKRQKGAYAVIRFVYNPNKLSHKLYVERILGGNYAAA